jgi:uncharacterized repeat protein (TIGR01451 family)
MLRKTGVLLSFLLLFCARPSLSITTTNLGSTTPQQLAQLLAGPGVTVSNVTFTGANVAGGTFAGGLADGLNIDSGVILSSGDIANGVGPNDQDGIGTCHERPGDADLDAILGQKGATNDAAVLEFDFVPATSTVSFRYVFASEEYNEFVGSINDIFAFFIDGQNVALVPNTSTPVAINTVNLDTNSSFYKNNDPSDLGEPTPFGTQFDGFTTVMTATRTLTANVTHHIKLAIADNADCILDSAVFLQAGSFVGQPALTISKSAPAPVTSGTNLTYTITYGNTGNTDATGVVVKDSLPTGTSFVSATSGGQFSSGVVTWNVGTVNAGVTGQTVSFTVNVNATSGTVNNVNYTIEAANISPISGSAVNTTVVSGGCPTITVSPSTLPNGAPGAPYNQTITASGGTPPYVFSVTAGLLPPGLSLSSGGVLSGTPTSDGNFSFTVRAIDAVECSRTRNYTLTIASEAECGTITVTPSSLPNAALDAPYSATIHGSGGTAPFTFTVLSGALPPGLTLSSGGLLSGPPTTSGTYSFRIRARDSRGCLGSRTYTMTVGCTTLALSPTTLGAATPGTAYTQAITASGGQGPYTFAVTAGALPGGLILSADGVISGTPTATGSFSFTVAATDHNGCTGARIYTLAICPILTVSPAALANATAGTPYSQALGVSEGTGPYAFVVTAGPLPPGVTLSPAGLLSGTPLAPGTFSFAVTATDVNGCTASTTYTLAVCSVVAVTPAALPFGAVGIAYSATLTASGGPAPHTFAASGAVPPGLALSSGGTLSGTPTLSGGFTFTVTATDASGCAGRRTYTIGVTDSPPTITSLRLTPGPGEGFTLTVIGAGFVDGGTIFVDGVAYPATFISPTMVTVELPASAIPPNGSITVTVTNPGPTGATSNPASLTFCTAPEAPVDARIEPFGNPTGPLTATDFLVVRWQPPASGPPPASFEFRINGDSYTTVVGATSAVAPPRGSNDPITLFVRAKCNEQVTGPETSSPTYSLSPPVADFTFPAARVGTPVTFTDTSSPQATSWLWIFDDGGTSTVQSPTHTFSTAGTHRVALIASNGSGSSQTIKDVPVSTATSAAGAVTSSLRRFEPSAGSRWKLSEVPVSRLGPVWLQIASEGAEEAIVYLRFLDSDGRLVLERRLSVVGGESAINDVAAYGLDGLYTLELVSSQRIEAILRQPFDLRGKRSRADDTP